MLAQRASQRKLIAVTLDHLGNARADILEAITAAVLGYCGTRQTRECIAPARAQMRPEPFEPGDQPRGRRWITARVGSRQRPLWKLLLIAS
jgi:hypothetical protein